MWSPTEEKTTGKNVLCTKVTEPGKSHGGKGTVGNLDCIRHADPTLHLISSLAAPEAAAKEVSQSQGSTCPKGRHQSFSETQEGHEVQAVFLMILTCYLSFHLLSPRYTLEFPKAD